MAKFQNGPTLWLTNGSQTFEVPAGSPLEKRLRGQGYEDCDDPSATPEVVEASVATEAPAPAEATAPAEKTKAK